MSANYGLARETGLTGLKQVADSIDLMARAINRLAAAVEASNKKDAVPIGLVIRTDIPTEVQ